MSKFIQALESRTLFSSTLSSLLSSSGQLAKDVQTASADVTQYGSTLAKEVQSIKTDIHALPVSSPNRTLILQLQRDEHAAVLTLRRDVITIIHTATAHGRRTVFDAIRAYFNPTNAIAVARLAADISAISGALAAPIAKLGSDVTAGRTAFLGDLNNLVTANPTASTLQTDTTQIQTDSQTAIDKVTSDGQALQTDLSSLV